MKSCMRKKAKNYLLVFETFRNRGLLEKGEFVKVDGQVLIS